MNTEPIKIGIYEHYKKKKYEVIGEVVHSESGEILVIYKALYDIPNISKDTIWARPKTMFLEQISVNDILIPRFRYIEPL